jgi:hypothetical protein
MGIVDNFVKDINRRAIVLKRELNDFDSPDHSGAETPRLSKNYFHNSSHLMTRTQTQAMPLVLLPPLPSRRCGWKVTV